MPENTQGLDIQGLLHQVREVSAGQYPPSPIDLKRAPGRISPNVYSTQSEWNLYPTPTTEDGEPRFMKESEVPAYCGCQLLGLPKFYYEELIGKKPENLDEFDKFVRSAGERYDKVLDKSLPLREPLAILIASKKEKVDPHHIVAKYADIQAEAMVRQLARYSEAAKKMKELPFTEFAAEYGRDGYFYMNPGQTYSESVDLHAAPHMLNGIWPATYNLSQLLDGKWMFFDQFGLNPPMSSGSIESGALSRLPEDVTQPVIQKIQEAAQKYLGRNLSNAPYPKAAMDRGEWTFNPTETMLQSREAAARVFCAVEALDPEIPVVDKEQYDDMLYGSEAKPGTNRVVQSMKIGLERSGQFYSNVTNYEELIHLVASVYPEKWAQLPENKLGWGDVWPHGQINRPVEYGESGEIHDEARNLQFNDQKACRERFEKAKSAIAKRIDEFIATQTNSGQTLSGDIEKRLDRIGAVAKVLCS